MDAVIDATQQSNMLPLVKNGTCEGCLETAKDEDVLHCYLCKNFFHVSKKCPVVETLPDDALPSATNRSAFIKYSAKSYPTGSFIWTCFRCGCIKQLASKDNIDQRVALLESMLITLKPALSHLAKLVNDNTSKDIEKLVSELRASTAGSADDTVSTDTHAHSTPPTVTHEQTQNPECPSTQPLPSVIIPPDAGQSVVGTGTNILETAAAPGNEESSRFPAARILGARMRIRVSSKDGDGTPLRSSFQRAHAAGKIGCYNMRYHSNHKADLIFDNCDDAATAYQCIKAEFGSLDVGTPTCTNTKLVHIVGLTADDKKETVYNDICKPGRNRAIEHLLNPYTFRVLSVNPCNDKQHVYRATAVVSEEIWDIILNKMNKKVKVAYLSCPVFCRPNSVRCFKCQRLGHTAQTCTNNRTCANCGGDHKTDGCTNEPNCINCSELGLDCNHRADSADCPTFRDFRKGSLKN